MQTEAFYMALLIVLLLLVLTELRSYSLFFSRVLHLGLFQPNRSAGYSILSTNLSRPFITYMIMPCSIILASTVHTSFRYLF